MDNFVTPMHFYFDFISPFGYFAALRVGDLASKHGRDCEWHAMLLGVSILKVMGLKPLVETPLKGPYLTHDAARYARRHRIALKRPLDGPAMNPVPAARAFHWLKCHHADRYRGIAVDMLDAYWREARDLADPSEIAAIAAGRGIDSAACRAAIESDEARQLLRAAVDASLNKGVFGSPFFIIDDEPFWGVDKMEQIDEWLTMGGW
jgi:2-hydroxychromene-2-carboxylate isomerase